MPAWVNRLIANATKAMVLAQAAQALGEWLDRAGWTPETLDAALQAGQPVLEEAWATIPWDEVQRLAPRLKPLAAQLTLDDYPAILQALAGVPRWQPFAELLYYHHYAAFEAGVERLRQLFLSL